MADKDTETQRREQQQEQQQAQGQNGEVRSQVKQDWQPREGETGRGETGAGEAPGETDQYEVNQPQSMPRDTAGDARTRRDQARAQADHETAPKPEDGAVHPEEEDAEGRGYGGREEIVEDLKESGKGD